MRRNKQSLRSDDLSFHESVLLRETVDFLRVKEGKKYIDATLGGGGHTQEILKLGGEVLGIDQDPEAINYVRNNLKNSKLKIIQGNFRNIDNLARKEELERVSGVLYDLGISSFQIEDENRGFSFQKEADLDMRMNPTSSSGQARASDILNLASEDELNEIFTKFGEEHRSRAISNSIVRARRTKAFEKTSDLLKVIEGVYGLRGSLSDKFRASIAKRVFQALRIAVNDELGSLKESLPKALSLLEDGGRLVVISFHSLEDRIVKQSFLDFEKQGFGGVITKRCVLPSSEEVRLNRRARSAKLRAFERKL